MSTKKAVVLLGFGGPQSLDEVELFLKQLFSDPVLFDYPKFFRNFLAWALVKKNLKRSRAVYASIGGGSPYVLETHKQAKMLQEALGNKIKVFAAMRYGKPDFSGVMQEVISFSPEEVLLLPMYPHFSMTTTRSAFLEWQRLSYIFGNRKTKEICCYPIHPGFTQAYGDLLLQSLQKIKNLKNARVLFSAHGTPMSFVKSGDPYTQQIESSYKNIWRYIEKFLKVVPESLVCYQSKVGPMRWTEPSLIDEIKRAGSEKKSLVVLPISFISEHSETLAELDIEAAELAESCGVPQFIRVPTVSCHPKFIKGLADIVQNDSVVFRNCSIENKQCWRSKSYKVF